MRIVIKKGFIKPELEIVDVVLVTGADASPGGGNTVLNPENPVEI